MKNSHMTILLALIMSGVFAKSGLAKSSKDDCPMMSAEHAATVDAQGDKAMGFSHTRTTHHFHILSDGGAIEVQANDANDVTSRDEIRSHLRHIAGMFEEGNFNVPMLVHDRLPDGATTMQALKDRISYHFQETERGGQVRMTTTDQKALAAIHEFMRFQIREHRTGDPMQ